MNKAELIEAMVSRTGHSKKVYISQSYVTLYLKIYTLEYQKL